MDLPRYDIRVEPVAEVYLDGAADAGWWAHHLAPAGLLPAQVEGHARVRVGVTASRFLGIPFREALVAVTVDGGPHGPGTYLFAAANDLRFFAWVERTRNKSPYAHAVLSLQPDGPEPGFAVTIAGGASVRASGTPLAGAAEIHERFVGPIYLPAYAGRSGYHFLAHLESPSRVWPFDPARDRWELGGAGPIVDALRESGFTPHRWATSTAAMHEKTNTRRA